MKILKKKYFDKPSWHKAGKLIFQWSLGVLDINDKFIETRHLANVETVLKKDFKIDLAMIVQLNKKEAQKLGLKSALGVIEGTNLLPQQFDQ